MTEGLRIINPKRSAVETGYESWYPYYAGFSSDFVSSILQTSKLSKDACIVDGWNGSGTTTTTANQAGYATIGYDLNPVMIIAAKACMLNRRDITSLRPLANEIVKKVRRLSSDGLKGEPLATWFIPGSAIVIRRIEQTIQNLLLDTNKYHPLTDESNVESLSSIAAFFYVALFRTVRELIEPFKGSNPTWIKKPQSENNRIRPSSNRIIELFESEITFMLSAIEKEPIPNASNLISSLNVASSCAMPADANSADLIISSPPYCTRIDYAVATMPELTVLGYMPDSNLDELRRKLIGTSTVPKDAPKVNRIWGQTCSEFLELLYAHDSKASQSYYYKNHLQYFDSMSKSIGELYRITKENGHCILVVQDSYYKNIHNDLATVIVEMAQNQGLTFKRRDDFLAERNMAGINPKVKKYRSKAAATESVLCFTK